MSLAPHPSREFSRTWNHPRIWPGRWRARCAIWIRRVPSAKRVRTPGRGPDREARRQKMPGAGTQVCRRPARGLTENRRDPIQPIAEQQRPLRGRLGAMQALGQCPLPIPPDAQSPRRADRAGDFQQNGGPDLGKGRAAPTRARFDGRRADLRRVGQAQLCPVERHQAPAPPERLALPMRRSGPQDPAHQLGKVAHGKRARRSHATVAKASANSSVRMLAQAAGAAAACERSAPGPIHLHRTRRLRPRPDAHHRFHEPTSRSDAAKTSHSVPA